MLSNKWTFSLTYLVMLVARWVCHGAYGYAWCGST